jgi:hypothetical protein
MSPRQLPHQTPPAKSQVVPTPPHELRKRLARRKSLLEAAEGLGVAQKIGGWSAAFAGVVLAHGTYVAAGGESEVQRLIYRSDALSRAAAVGALAVLAIVQVWNWRRAKVRPIGALLVAATAWATPVLVWTVATARPSAPVFEGLLEVLAFGGGGLAAVYAAWSFVRRESAEELPSDPLLRTPSLAPHADSLIEAVDAQHREGILDLGLLGALLLVAAAATLLFGVRAPGLEARSLELQRALSSGNVDLERFVAPSEREQRLADLERDVAAWRVGALEAASGETLDAHYEGALALVALPARSGGVSVAWRFVEGEWRVAEVRRP